MNFKNVSQKNLMINQDIPLTKHYYLLYYNYETKNYVLQFLYYYACFIMTPNMLDNKIF